MEKTIYISGKITGTADYEAKFAAAEKKLEEQGYLVINPVEHGKWLQGIFSPVLSFLRIEYLGHQLPFLSRFRLGRAALKLADVGFPLGLSRKGG